MVQYYNSGYINFRDRKIGIVFSGETSQHIMEEHLKDAKTHPLKHLRIQQLAKQVKVWDRVGDKRYTGTIRDTNTGLTFFIAADIYPKLAILVTAFKNKEVIMTYLEKLIKLEGKKPDVLPYHQKINKIKTEELAARNMFRALMGIPSEKKKAKKLGLI